MEQSPTSIKLDQVRRLIDMGLVYFDYEQILEFHYRKWIQPGDTVIDIGAHIGRHLGPMIEAIGSEGTALAFEPIPFAFSEVSRKYSNPNVSINNVALSNYTGDSDFTFADGAAEESGLIQRTFNSPETTKPIIISVHVDRLDNYTANLESISFIKIDIEGGEINCLRGAKETIKKFRPIMSVEYGEPAYTAYGNTADTLFELANTINYTIYDIFLNRILNIEDWRASVNRVYWDFILVPLEKVSAFERRTLHNNTQKMPNPKDTMISLNEHNNAINSVRNELEHTLTEIENTLSKARAESDRYKAHINSILTSTSWKITAPVRAIINAIRRTA